MAMFLSRIKKALNLGTKNITVNGTYNASSDGYDGYSSVEVNVAGVTPTPITPSNVSPVALTSGTAVSPTANGYAIQSYDSVTPSSTPESVASGDIVKIGGSGVIVDSVPPTPTSITPSNSSPVTLSANTPVNPTDGGYAIESYEEITPKNSNPPTLLLGHIYKIKTRNGIAIGAVNTVFPSDDDPPLLPVGSYNFVNGASGYLYSKIQPKVATGTFTRTTSSDNTINCGFAPDMIFLIKGSGTTTTVSVGDFRVAYWNGWSTSYVVDDYRSSSGYYLKNDTASDFFTITSTGFVYAKASSSTYAGTVKYIAVKYT